MLYPFNTETDSCSVCGASSFSQPGDAEMLAETFDIVSEGCGCVIDANGKNGIDDAERKVVLAHLPPG